MLSLKQWLQQSWIRHIIHHLEERDVALNGSSWQSTMEKPDRAIDNCQGYCQVDQHLFQKHLSLRKHLTDGGECIALPASVKLGILHAHLSQKGGGTELRSDAQLRVPHWGQSPASCGYVPTSFWLDHHVVLSWLVEWMMIWVWIQSLN